ncbi:MULTISPECIES: hypothetical protein [Ramlibacter]|uniref:YMGG-like Gly-zipper domain-containing protein n=1 Tax=Ramlibacter pinisoli TaxID=2682844 RepID=A0A6N8IW12_9BURK|nr:MULTISPECIES: hypothetical protein [Ramlibacter]MBA2960916.1 hypothetical protein [Ramlibacter sp. CGMCC 1.13660]MVQ30862.1 hypothetical protein [Ramlibacter pinisoli]
MHSTPRTLLLAAALASAASLALAAKPIAYPAKGQSQQQQTKDDGECGGWATQQTGVNPNAPPPVAAAPAQGRVGGGMARGAVAGATIGAIGDNDVGEAAAKGAVIGGVARGARNRSNQEAAAQQNQQSQAQYAQNLDTFHRAWGSCMAGRGYTLN